MVEADVILRQALVPGWWGLLTRARPPYGDPLAALTVPPCEFLLDYEDDDEDDEEPGRRAKKKPWRYRWPDAFRDTVLALLLDLNAERAEQERLTATPPEKPKRGGRKKPGTNPGTGLFT